jgi:hypothetical protein
MRKPRTPERSSRAARRKERAAIRLRSSCPTICPLTICPSAIRTMRSARSASTGSWVTMTRAAPDLGDEVEHQVGDDGGGLAVEVAGRLVGEQQGRAGGQGAGQGHALLLAARQLVRIVGQARGQADTVPATGGRWPGRPWRRRSPAAWRRSPRPSCWAAGGRPGRPAPRGRAAAGPDRPRPAWPSPGRTGAPRPRSAAPARRPRRSATTCPSPTARSPPAARPVATDRSTPRRMFTGPAAEGRVRATASRERTGAGDTEPSAPKLSAMKLPEFVDIVWMTASLHRKP